MRTAMAGKCVLWATAALLTAAAVAAGPSASPTTGPASRPAGPDQDEGKITPIRIDTSATRPRAVLEPTTRPGPARPRVAHVRVGGTVLASPPAFTLFGDSGGAMTLREWLQRLARARKDSSITGVALTIDSPRMSWAHAQELADAVRRLNDVKPVCAHIASGGPMAYLIASAAQDLAMEPAGSLNIVGLGAELTFFKGALDWLGVEPQFIQIGRFKGAAEPMSRTRPSKEMLGEYEKILDDLYDQLCTQIARQRKLTVPHVKHAIDQGPLHAQDALKYQFVDRLVPRAQWREHVAGRFRGTGAARGVTWVDSYSLPRRQQADVSNPFQLLGMLMGGQTETPTKDPTIAIVHVDGMITGGASGEGLFGERFVGARTIAATLEAITEDENVKAVVLRINSPGGGALASEQIYQAVRKCGATKPVIASISGLGASGGYYIAVGARMILADAAGLVGSIGVVGGKLSPKGLMDKVGITTHEITRGRNAGLWLSRPWNKRERAVVRRQMQRTYDLFVKRVSESRGKKVPDVSRVAAGRIFTARQAVRNGLIDGVGGLREAILAAQKAAGVNQTHFITLPRPRSLGEALLGSMGARSDFARDAMRSALLRRLAHRGRGLVYLLNFADRLDRDTILTAMPYWFSLRY